MKPKIRPKAFKNSLNPICASSRYINLILGVERERARNKVYDDAVATELATDESPKCKTYSIKYIGQTNQGNFGITSRKQPILTKSQMNLKSLSSVKMQM